jgi:hypothetical protein
MQRMNQGSKRYIVASDFDQTLSFHDSGRELSELVGIPGGEFDRKRTILAVQNLVQQGGELAYLLLHDPDLQGAGAKRTFAASGQKNPAQEKHPVIARPFGQRHRGLPL